MNRRLRTCALAMVFVCLTFLASGSADAPPAETWKDAYPEIYLSYLENNKNADITDYLAQHPELATLYEGNAFTFSYGSPRGHTYSLQDLLDTGRPHPYANCLTCKTPDFTSLVNSQGIGAYRMYFTGALEMVGQPISCVSCHGEVPGTFPAVHGYLTDAIGENSGIKPQTLSCAQCHVEYYFPKDTQATTLPYESLDGMSPDAILAYYNRIGFTDFVNPRTGASMIKVQHPEFETYTGKGSVHGAAFSCAVCHMGTAESDTGVSYPSHNWVSPLENAPVADSCAQCHADLEGKVEGIQQATEARTAEVAAILVALTNRLAQAVASGQADTDTVATARSLLRDAQFYWDFVFVENAEGAHNSALAADCLGKAQALAGQGIALLGD